MIRVGLVAGSLATRVGLRALLELDERIRVVVEASRKEKLPDSAPIFDVLVLAGANADIESATTPDNEQEYSLLWLTENPPAARGLAALPVRVWGWLPEDTGAEEIHAAVAALALGMVVTPPGLLGSVLEAAESVERFAGEEGRDVLTEREVEVLALVAQGMANKEIATTLSISAHTVKFHISSIYSKLGAGNRTEAVRMGYRQGLIVL